MKIARRRDAGYTVRVAALLSVRPAHGSGALPPNKWMQLTMQLVTRRAKRRARQAPSCLAADPGR
jgi:hypothetical protein